MCAYVCTYVLAEICFDCFVFCCVMGCVLHFGEIAHKRIPYCYVSGERMEDDCQFAL